MRRPRCEVDVEATDSDDDVVIELPRTAAAPRRPPPPLAAAAVAGAAVSPARPTWQVLQPVDPGDRSTDRGWIAVGRLPDRLDMSDRVLGLEAMLAAVPAERGRIMMMGRLIPTPRFQQAFLEDYKFTGVNHLAAQALPPVATQLLQWANEQLPQHWFPDCGDSKLFNSSLVNWYMDGSHYVGPHADDERALHPGSPIFSLSLGQTRTFRIRRTHDGSNAPVRDLELRHRDFVVMGGAMQKNFKHEIVKISGERARLMGPRVNVTFRCFNIAARPPPTSRDE